MKCFNNDYQNIKNEFYKPKQNDNIKEILSRQHKNNKIIHDHIIQTDVDKNHDDADSLSSYRNINLKRISSLQQSSRSAVDLPINDQESKMFMICKR